ncbi:MAG: hypothetical protein JHC33_11470 [Ignisphaera sp.]|nr:hypothetical protein [Ignisphaera sp.]
MLEDFVKNYLSDRHWRLNNLYYIVNKEDTVVQMRLNAAQEKVFAVKHPKTITLKSRQQGISTFKVAEGLDKCIFRDNTQAGVQSYGQNEAKKLYKKAVFMWDNFDPQIKELLGIKLDSSNSEGLTFSNGSTLRIGNFRGDTLSSLHVSELAKIAKRFPDKAEELNTGAFEAVSTNSSISVESTAEGKTGLFFTMWRTAERRVKLVGAEGLTPLDFYPIFLSWIDDPDCSMDEYYEASDDDLEYFTRVEKDLAITLTQGQKNWCSAKRERLADKFDQEYPYSPESAFNVSVEGTYYKLQYEKLINSKRIKPTPYEDGQPVYAIFDLGMNDRMCINFTQIIQGVPKVIGEYDNNGQSIEFYVEIMSKLPYNIDWAILPHDANVKELSTGRTRLEEFRRLGVRCKLLPKFSLQEGINAARQYLSVVEIDENCNETIIAIQNYRQKYDKRLDVYLGVPEHDDYSHYADVIRYSALGLTYHKVKNTIEKTNEEKYRTAKENYFDRMAL